MDMTYDTMDRDENVKTLALFADVRVYIQHPNGLLFATQFAQFALVVIEKAAFEDMRVKGFVQRGCAFAGHSLSKYSALAFIADVLLISALVGVVFHRGIGPLNVTLKTVQNMQCVRSTQAEFPRRSVMLHCERWSTTSPSFRVHFPRLSITNS